MSCPQCEQYTDSHGKCWNKICPNWRGEPKLPGTKRMRSKSPKQAKIDRDTHPLRGQILKTLQPCDGGCGRSAIDTHEIPAGIGRRHLAMHRLRALAFLCRECHQRYQGAPAEEQIAMITRSVIRAVNECYGSVQVNTEQVIQELRK